MPFFFGICPGERIERTGISVCVSDDGERVWMHGKWLDLASHHGVLFLDEGESAAFVTQGGIRKSLGDFPAWVVRGQGKKKALCAMFGVDQFRGGKIVVSSTSARAEHQIPA